MRRLIFDKKSPIGILNGIVDETTAKWNAELSKLQVSTTDTVAKRIFYTALYHAFIQPAMFNDCNKEYRGTDKNVYGDPGFTNYTVFSLWDTYRAAHPLYTLVQPERVPDFINSCWLFMSNKDVCRFGICMARTRMK